MFLPREAFPTVRTENHVHTPSMFVYFFDCGRLCFTPVFLEMSDRLNWDRFEMVLKIQQNQKTRFAEGARTWMGLVHDLWR